MILWHHACANFWLRLKLLLSVGSPKAAVLGSKPPATKPKPRKPRATAFFEMP
jgi:hypothetical protein